MKRQTLAFPALLIKGSGLPADPAGGHAPAEAGRAGGGPASPREGLRADS